MSSPPDCRRARRLLSSPTLGRSSSVRVPSSIAAAGPRSLACRSTRWSGWRSRPISPRPARSVRRDSPSPSPARAREACGFRFAVCHLQIGGDGLTLVMRTLKLTLAYDGTNYVGWQRQQNGTSIQQVIEEALQPLCGETVPILMGAGRTDAGVHAQGQVASVRVTFDHTPRAVQQALNVRLPRDIRVLDVT